MRVRIVKRSRSQSKGFRIKEVRQIMDLIVCVRTDKKIIHGDFACGLIDLGCI